MSLRQRWLKAFGPDKEIWVISESGDVKEYLTRDKPDGDPFGRQPVFHVWKGDQWLYCGASQQKADAAFHAAVEDSE